MYYHASPYKEIQVLVPHTSNHGKPLIYLSSRRENTLPYLSNAVELYGKRTGRFPNGPYHKWGSYGFTPEGILRLEEYYPNATKDTYQGIPGCIYTVEGNDDIKEQPDIPYAFIAEHNIPVVGCEYIPDAYSAILEAAAQGKIILQKYEDNSEEKLRWIKSGIRQEYERTQRAEYRAFLWDKFPFLHG